MCSLKQSFQCLSKLPWEAKNSQKELIQPFNSKSHFKKNFLTRTKRFLARFHPVQIFKHQTMKTVSFKKKYAASEMLITSWKSFSKCQRKKFFADAFFSFCNGSCSSRWTNTINKNKKLICYWDDWVKWKTTHTKGATTLWMQCK